MTGVAVAIGVSLLIIAVVMWVAKHRSPARSTVKGQSEASGVHLPSDDPLWLAHSQRVSKRPRRSQRRRKIWAAGTAGAVGAGYADPGGSYGGGSGSGESSCGGG